MRSRQIDRHLTNTLLQQGDIKRTLQPGTFPTVLISKPLKQLD